MLLKTKEHKLVETDGLIQDLLERIESKDCTLKKLYGQILVNLTLDGLNIWLK